MGSLTLNAGPQPDHRDRIIASLETENRELKDKIEEMRLEAQQANKAVEQGVGELRRVLLPLHQAMRLVFGEIDRIAPVGESYHSNPQSDKKRAIWESWKKKLGGQQANFIDALLEHGQMTAAQLRVAMHCGRDAVYQVASKLGKLGLVEQNGGKYSLKEL
jgi:3-oxoacyl-[acyl-carrier-protein] synthase III